MNLKFEADRSDFLGFPQGAARLVAGRKPFGPRAEVKGPNCLFFLIAGAESFYSLEGNMCGTVKRCAVALPGSKATSRAKGSHRKLGGLVQCGQVRAIPT
jgi:hypothetical protein